RQHTLCYRHWSSDVCSSDLGAARNLVNSQARGGSMRTLLFATALAVSLSAQAQIEKPDVHIAVGGRTALYYLPLTLTERLGYFKIGRASCRKEGRYQRWKYG